MLEIFSVKTDFFIRGKNNFIVIPLLLEYIIPETYLPKTTRMRNLLKNQPEKMLIDHIKIMDINNVKKNP